MSQRNEGSRRMNGVSHWLIHQAAQRAPECLSSRLEEEWLADFESRSAAGSRLRFAVGCCWATMVIVHESSRVQAASTAVSAGGIVTLTDRNLGYFSLRSATLFLIAGLHGALFYGMITTLSHTHGTAAVPNLQNQEVKPARRETAPLPAPGSEFKDWTIHVPRPVVDALPKIEFDQHLTGDFSDEPREVISEPSLPPVTPTHSVLHVAGGPGAGFPETGEFYPSHSIHLGEEGISTVRVCVDSRGRLTSDPATVNGSGSARLDDAALKLARAGSGHYRATTEDGQPVNSCYAFGVRFQLKK
jgi:TonB family protein